MVEVPRSEWFQMTGEALEQQKDVNVFIGEAKKTERKTGLCPLTGRELQMVQECGLDEGDVFLLFTVQTHQDPGSVMNGVYQLQFRYIVFLRDLKKQVPGDAFVIQLGGNFFGDLFAAAV